MSGNASATPRPGSSQQTSSSESPTDLDEAGRKVYDNKQGPVLESVHLIHTPKKLCYLKL